MEDDILHFDKGKYMDEYDCIVSNPPYITLAEKAQMHVNVLENEPHLALFTAENDALIFYKAIVNFAKDHLASGACLYFEINENFGKEIADLLDESGFVYVEIKRDLNGKERMVKAQSPAKA